ncbi:hypothetical protein [Luteimonas aquatica]|uniref:hypothetical protein n=1 Tax=Luteimonas aquatica TaxID=450364 RepID=UPI001F55E4F9|nr:hypothetical protein [Luteimonas aquatica]
MKIITIKGIAATLLAASMTFGGSAYAEPTQPCTADNEGQSTWVWRSQGSYDVGELYVCTSGYWELRRRCFSNSPVCMEF